MFLLISTHFTVTPGIPVTPAKLQSTSFERSAAVKLQHFTPDLINRLHALYAQ